MNITESGLQIQYCVVPWDAWPTQARGILGGSMRLDN